MKIKKVIMKYSVAMLSLSLFIFGVVSLIEGLYMEKISSKAQVYIGCPTVGEWVGVGDFCMMKHELASGGRSWDSSTQFCKDDAGGARLCTAAEWVAACELNQAGEMLDGEFSDMLDDYEWVADHTDDDEAVLVGGGGDCHTMTVGNSWGSDSEDRRCCINKQY